MLEVPSHLRKRLSVFELPCVPLGRMRWASVWALRRGMKVLVVVCTVGVHMSAHGGYTCSHRWINGIVGSWVHCMTGHSQQLESCDGTQHNPMNTEAINY